MASVSAEEKVAHEERVLFGLTGDEKWWRDCYDLFKRHGYELRPRFRPGWTPSWIRKRTSPLLCEDGFPNFHPKVIDAIRVSDNARVAIKRLRKGSREVDIVRYLNSEELRNDPKNHAVPILDVFSERGDSMEFMVMPLLNWFDSPLFSSVDEVVDFMQQTLEGLSFLHGKGVAHRDCSILNIMMDGKDLYPRGFHPAAQDFDATGERFANPRNRRDVAGVKYYFTDFGLSSRFDDTSISRVVTGEDCQDRELPELNFDEPYDPFAVDVFLLGNVFKRKLIAKYKNLDCFAPLSNMMTQRDPRKRPTPETALQLLSDILRQQSLRSIRHLLQYRDADRVELFLCTFGSIRREMKGWLRLFLLRFYRRCCFGAGRAESSSRVSN